MTDLEAMKAAFLAKGGKVQQVAAGEGAGLTNADWRQAMQTPGRFDARNLGRQISDEDVEMHALQDMQRVREERGYFGR